MPRTRPRMAPRLERRPDIKNLNLEPQRLEQKANYGAELVFELNSNLRLVRVPVRDAWQPWPRRGLRSSVPWAWLMKDRPAPRAAGSVLRWGDARPTVLSHLLGKREALRSREAEKGLEGRGPPVLQPRRRGDPTPALLHVLPGERLPAGGHEQGTCAHSPRWPSAHLQGVWTQTATRPPGAEAVGRVPRVPAVRGRR